MSGRPARDLEDRATGALRDNPGEVPDGGISITLPEASRSPSTETRAASCCRSIRPSPPRPRGQHWQRIWKPGGTQWETYMSRGRAHIGVGGSGHRGDMEPLLCSEPSGRPLPSFPSPFPSPSPRLAFCTKGSDNSVRCLARISSGCDPRPTKGNNDMKIEVPGVPWSRVRNAVAKT